MPDTSTTLDVDLGARGYPIHVGHGLLDRAPALLGPCLEGRRVFMLTDSGLAATPHPDRLARALASAGIEARRVEVPAGEASKGLPTLGRVLDLMIEGGLERGGVLVTLGGGVVGDLGGFAAAVALRGIDYIQVPTTLLAQVDSAVGGKTGVNSRFGKNLIGAFHQPKAVLVDLAVLDTLPARELRAGYAEVLKYGCIRDAAFFAWLEANGERVLALEPDTLRHAVRRSIEIKAAIVAADERETGGVRALLNFGHTFAHAYEALAGYGGRLLHGEAVALGMCQAARLSTLHGLATAADEARLKAHLAGLGLHHAADDVDGDAFDTEALIAAMGRDKKVTDGRIGFVLWEGPGRARAGVAVPLDRVRRAIEGGS